MEHNIPLITTIAASLGVASIFGFIAEKCKVPALVGYLLAGVALGPFTPGVVADIHIASQLSEIGIMLLMFGVGLHFSMRDLLAVKKIAIRGAVVQMGLATILGMMLVYGWGWSLGSGLVFGLSLSCASTVVLLKALESNGILRTMNGRIAVGWLVVEDLATVLFLVLLPALAPLLGGQGEGTSTTPVWISISQTLLQIGAFIALMLIVGRRFLPKLLSQVARLGSRELFTLVVIAIAISIAYGAAKLFHVSFALGAFFAGMVMCESEFSHRAAKESLPLRDAFSVLFFVSVGMLFDPRILVEQPIAVLAVVTIIVIGKSIAALGLVLAFRYPLNTALIVATSLAQIGEFSFILAGLAVAHGLMTVEGMGLILAGALISIALNPFLFRALSPFQEWLLKRSPLAQRLARRQDPYAELPMSTERKYLQNQVVLVGYGQVGSRMGKELAQEGIHTIVVEQNRELVENLRKEGVLAVSGNAADPAVLIQAHIANACMLLIAVADPLNVRQMIDTAKMLNPDIEIILRTHSESESKLLTQAGADKVFFDEELIATGMIEHALEKMASPKKA